VEGGRIQRRAQPGGGVQQDLDVGAGEQDGRLAVVVAPQQPVRHHLMTRVDGVQAGRQAPYRAQPHRVPDRFGALGPQRPRQRGIDHQVGRAEFLLMAGESGQADAGSFQADAQGPAELQVILHQARPVGHHGDSRAGHGRASAVRADSPAVA